MFGHVEDYEIDQEITYNPDVIAELVIDIVDPTEFESDNILEKAILKEMPDDEIINAIFTWRLFHALVKTKVNYTLDRDVFEYFERDDYMPDYTVMDINLGADDCVEWLK